MFQARLDDLSGRVDLQNQNHLSEEYILDVKANTALMQASSLATAGALLRTELLGTAEAVMPLLYKSRVCKRELLPLRQEAQVYPRFLCRAHAASLLF